MHWRCGQLMALRVLPQMQPVSRQTASWRFMNPKADQWPKTMVWSREAR